MANKVFVDTNPLIYLVSGQEPYCTKVLNLFANYIELNWDFCTSTITDAEFLTKPLAENDFSKIEEYKKYLKKLEFEKVVISEEIAETAASIRSKYKTIKLADALQIATGINSNCDDFMTNDKQLKQISEINIVYIGDL